ncbi:MAG: WD40 repeat domain-containing protein, partial [Acidobacteria bacterium]|nr:WD40 repeat domain-containing protein [Acidobacteriota bacterium]
MKRACLVVLFFCFTPALAQAPTATQKPLTQTQLHQLVEAGVDNERLAQTVTRRGIGFELSGDFVAALRQQGALPVLLKALGERGLKSGQIPLDENLLRELVAAGMDNLLLVKAVLERGIDFRPAADYLKALQKAGALEPLLKALREVVSKPLAKDQVLNLLSSGVSNDRVAALVNKRGLNFKPTDEYLDTLRIAGASDGVVDAVRAARRPPEFILLHRLEAHGPGIHPLAFSSDGRMLASVAGPSAVRLWSVAGGTEIRVVGTHDDLVRSLAFSPDGRYLASAGYDSMIKIWEVETGREPRILRGHDGDVNAIAVSPDGKYLASGGQDGTVKLWDLEMGVAVRTLANRELAIFALAFSPDGARIASGRSDNLIQFWDVPTGKDLGILRGHTGAVQGVAFSPDGERLASASSDGTIKLWAVASGRETKTFAGNTIAVWCVAFTRDGRYLASGSADASLRLWEVETGLEVSQLLAPSIGTVPTLAFSEDG